MSQQTQQHTNSFLPHINGLRAICILGICAYHLQNALCPCGYFGVDLFLLISGYFLFRNDLGKLENGQQSYGRYLLKKAWRLSPPWICVALPVCLICAFIMPYERGRIVLMSAASSAAAFSNDYAAASGNYFNPNTQENPLLHLWYIGLIEQAYILIPLLVGLNSHWNRKCRLGILLGFGICSFLFNLLLRYGSDLPTLCRYSDACSSINPYYSLSCRLWEVLLGGAIAFAAGRLRPEESRRGDFLRSSLALLALAAYVASLYFYPSGSACVFPAVLAGGILLFYGNRGLCGWLLRNRAIQELGRISFSLYLSHWPVFVLWKYCRFQDCGAYDYLGMGLLSLLLALLLYYFVEKRCGRWALQLGEGWQLRLSISIPALIFGSGLALAQIPDAAELWPARIAPEISHFHHPYPSPANKADLAGLPSGVFSNSPRSIGQRMEIAPSFLLLGDSHAWHLVVGLAQACDAEAMRGIYLNNSCVPLWNYHLILNSGNARWDEARARALLAWMEEQSDIRYILFSDYWALRLKDRSGKDWDMKPIPAGERQRRMREGLAEMCRQLQCRGKQVIILRDSPRLPGRNAYDLYQRCLFLGKDFEEACTSEERYRQDNAEAEAIFQGLEREGLALVFDTADYLKHDGVYSLRSPDGHFYYRDSNHLSCYGSALAARRIMEQLKAQPKQKAAAENN